MYISDLELHGFKSFADKTDVHFDSGITAIVGPNGCGKSNIVDALRWVLGEQRPTLLRSSNMTNVIFNGTNERNQLGMAEVSLTLVNNRGVLPTEYNEVTITRRLYRSGDSEYLINNTVCRLKDIMELFMDTGMGSDAYSVIELSMVDEILNDKNDRRRLFEEAAGITKYKDKRKRTYRKLEETKEDLQRVDDILVEVRNKVTSLKSQATKAKKARKYRSELEVLDKAINYHEYQNVKEELEPLDERINNAEKEKKQITNKLEELESAAKKARSDLNKKEKHQSEAERRVNQLENQIRDHETELKIKREKIENEKSVIEQHEQDIEQTQSDLKELRELHQSSSQKLEQFEKDLQKAEQELENSEQRYNEVQQQYREHKEELDQVNDQFATANNELNELQTRRIKLESRIDNNEEEQVRLKEEIGDHEDEIGHFQGEVERVKKELQKAEQSYETLENKLANARQQRDKLNEQQNELKDKLRELNSQRDAVQSEMKLLEDIANSNEVYPSSVRYLLEEHQEAFEWLQPVSDLLSTDEKHAVALESVLDRAAYFLVVEDFEAARKASRILEENDKGQATFIPLDHLNGSYSVDPESLYYQVDTAKELEPLKKLFLGHVFVFDKIDDSNGSLKEHQAGVTYDGEVLTRDQFFRSGSLGDNVGLRVGFDDKIEKLQNQIETYDQKIEETRQELNETRQSYESLNINDLSEQLKTQDQKVQQLRQEKNNYQTQIEMHGSSVEELKQRQTQADEQKEQADEALDALYPEQKELQSRIRELSDQKDQINKQLEELEEERSIAQSRYNDAKLSHQDLKNKVENFEKDVRRAENGIQNMKERLEKRSEQSESAEQRITSYQDRIKVLKKELADFKEDKKEADQELKQVEEACSKQRGKIKRIEDEKEEVQNQKEVNTELIHHLNMAKNKFEMQAENITEYLWEEYEMMVDQIDERLPEDTELDEAKEEYDDLKQKLKRLGEVNPLAIEEYEEEKERLDFYEQQIEDLTDAEEQLKETIREINEKATEQFNTTFERIRDNFKKVFHTLFEDTDQCDLRLVEDEEDPLNSKIKIIANPRGKRPTNINQLSGGEKTLTAIALLFAIYLVKPSPFCVLDEVDAPLDDANIERFVNMLKQFRDDTQFIIITHNKKTMSNAERMYGVTMPDTGVSRLVSVQLEDVTN